MDDPLPSETVRLIARLQAGDRDAAAELFPRLYNELRTVAAAHLRHERTGHTLQATALLHEAYIKLVGHTPTDVSERAHFVSVAARSMRQVLVDHARRHGAVKRGGGRLRVTLDGAGMREDESGVDVMDLHEALERLSCMDDRKARVVELRFFGGLALPAVARALDVSLRTAEGDWSFARAWLRRELASHEGA